MRAIFLLNLFAVCFGRPECKSHGSPDGLVRTSDKMDMESIR